MVDEIKRALEIAEVIPFRYLIQHMGVGGEEFDMRKFDAAFSALEELSLFARQRGVEILLENIPNELSSAERLLQFDELTHLGLNFVFDTGHANMGEGVETAFQLMKDRIRSTHVHDNDGKERLAPVPAGQRGRHHRLEEHHATAPQPRRTVSAAAGIEGAGGSDASAGRGAGSVRQAGRT